MEHPVGDMDALLGPGATIRLLMGLWRPRGRVARVFSRLVGGVTLSSMGFVVLGAALKLCVDPPTELEQIALCCLVSTICSGFWLKSALFMAKGNTLRQAVQLLADARAQFSNGEQGERTRRRYLKLSHTVSFYAQVVALTAATGWITCPMLVMLARRAAGAEGDEQEAHRQLPSPVWLPVDVLASPTYELLYVVQSFGALVAAEACISINVFFVHMMLLVAAELEVLNDNICAIGHTNWQKMGRKTEEFVSTYEINGRRLALLNSGQSLDEQTLTENALHEWLYQQLVNNVLHHQAILRSVSLLQSAMTVSIFVLLFINMANLCSCLFIATVLLQRDGNIGKAANALFTIPGFLYETAIFCIYAHIMTDKSERLVYSAFSCDWINSDARFKRSLLIFMRVTQRPIEITVGKTCTLSKEMLLQVLNGTYALLNMLYYMQHSK